MNRSRTLELLRQIKPELTRRFGVRELALFGSTARGEARSDSDVDLLVTFDGPATSERYFGTLFAVEDALGCPVDLVTDKGLRPELSRAVARDRIALGD
ncbi:MAG: nucleotidyltransferase family protein [Burkholderiales bacterium]|jgi:predicted nucleotidyltransferase|nr:nucleotidyltransferase family protein [Burkholderiales bacterium]